jgi:hypothetical protein
MARLNVLRREPLCIITTKVHLTRRTLAPYTHLNFKTLKQWSNFSFHGLKIVKCKESLSRIVQSSRYSDYATGWGIGIRFPVEAEMFPFATASIPALEPIKPPIQCIPRTLSPSAKLPKCDAMYSSTSSSENEDWSRIQWRTGQGVSLPDGKWALWAPLNIRQYVKNVNMYNICTL